MNEYHFLALVLIFACATEIYSKPSKGGVATEFLILHNNDMHARFEQTSRESTKCTKQDEKANKCYGGFARVAHEVRKYRNASKNGGLPVFYLNAGDTYTGTPWFTVFRDNITASFLNKLQPDAISLGNHEFDDGVSGLVPFLNTAAFPVLACNLDLNSASEIAATKSFANSTVLEVNGVRVGVIGYVTPETKTLVSKMPVEFKPEIPSINEEASKMKEAGINIIIALGHSGYQKDKEIAANCPDVDIVIGGHTNTFLYDSDVQPDMERIEGPYPTIVKQKSGKTVIVVQAYAYTKYLGKLHVQFDKNGELIDFDGSPILLDSSVPRDTDVVALLEMYRPNITALEGEIVGHTKVFLDGSKSSCRVTECNLGNLVADSMVFARMQEDEGGVYWTDAAIAFIGGGGIRSSIKKTSDGSITATDLLQVLPFNNELFVTKVSGKTIKKALERSASLRMTDNDGGFLQMAGVRAVFDFSNPEGSRVLSAEIRCAECDVPVFEPLSEQRLYKAVVQKFLLDGGDGHDFKAEDNFEPVQLQRGDLAALKDYISKQDYVYPHIEGRIVSIEKSSGRNLSSSLYMVIASFLLMLKWFI